MTTESSGKLSREDLAKYGGERPCGYYAECNLLGASEICCLGQGYNHPKCPGRIKAREEAKELMKTDPEFAAKYKLVENDQKE